MQYGDFNRKNLDGFRAELNALLAKYGEVRNLKFTVGNFKYNSTEIELKAAVAGVETVSDRHLNTLLAERGLKKKATIPGHGEVEIVDYVRRRYRRPWALKVVATGKALVANDVYVNSMFRA